MTEHIRIKAIDQDAVGGPDHFELGVLLNAIPPGLLFLKTAIDSPELTVQIFVRKIIMPTSEVIHLPVLRFDLLNSNAHGDHLLGEVCLTSDLVYVYNQKSKTCRLSPQKGYDLDSAIRLALATNFRRLVLKQGNAMLFGLKIDKTMNPKPLPDEEVSSIADLDVLFSYSTVLTILNYPGIYNYRRLCTPGIAFIAYENGAAIPATNTRDISGT